jgi:hypothetical protein
MLALRRGGGAGMRARHIAVSVMALVAMAAGRLCAQDSARVNRDGWVIAGSLGVFGAGGQTAPLELTTVGVSFTHVRPGGLGADIAIGTMPRALVAGLFVLGSRLDATVALPIAPGVLLLPAGGLSVIGGMGEGGGGGLIGYNLGGAAVFGTGSVGLRTGLTWHQFQESGSGVWLLEVGVARLPGFPRR